MNVHRVAFCLAVSLSFFSCERAQRGTLSLKGVIDGNVMINESGEWQIDPDYAGPKHLNTCNGALCDSALGSAVVPDFAMVSPKSSDFVKADLELSITQVTVGKDVGTIRFVGRNKSLTNGYSTPTGGLSIDEVVFTGDVQSPVELVITAKDNLMKEGLDLNYDGKFYLSSVCAYGGNVWCGGALKSDPEVVTLDPREGSDCPPEVEQLFVDADPMASFTISSSKAKSGSAREMRCVSGQGPVFCGANATVTADGCDWKVTGLALGTEFGMHVLGVASESCTRAKGRYCNSRYSNTAKK